VASYLETTKSNSVRMATIPLRGAQRLPFNVELAAGSLAQDRFRGYILQDAIYLGGPLAIAAAQAPDRTWNTVRCDSLLEGNGFEPSVPRR
jgi:hypothetical protein